MLRTICMVFAALVLLVGCTVIRPHESTATRMLGLQSRLKQYYRNNGSLPDSLDVLPLDPKKTNNTDDGWGHPIDYQKPSSDSAVLFSRGRDGVVGGNGRDEDFTIRLQVVDEGLEMVYSDMPLSGWKWDKRPDRASEVD